MVSRRTRAIRPQAGEAVDGNTASRSVANAEAGPEHCNLTCTGAGKVRSMVQGHAGHTQTRR
jgi:hypothetical protein